jgi:short-subunit dehydrogenase
MARSAEAFRARYGPWAVVAGASSGLGEAYARALAARGINVALIARRRSLAEALAAKLAGRHGIQTRVIELNLARADAGEIVAAATADLDVGLLVYNAAFSAIGPFFERPVNDHLRELETNCRAPLLLAYALGQRLLARGRGGIVVMSSLSATMGSALIANYAATKAYNQVLAEGLWEELRGRGVDVMACCAGATSTPNYAASAPKGARGTLTPAAVAEQTLAALGTTPSFIPGRGNRLSAFALRRLMPRKATIKLMGGVMRRMYAR